MKSFILYYIIVTNLIGFGMISWYVEMCKYAIKEAADTKYQRVTLRIATVLFYIITVPIFVPIKFGMFLVKDLE